MRNTWIGLALVVLAALLAGSSLARPGFYDSHDGLLNVHRLVELEACFADGQIPCRWVPHMGAGYGYPLFNFYPPLPTHVAAGFRVLGGGVLDAIKWTTWLALIVAALSMFALARSFFGTRGAVVAAVLYVSTPYFAADLFVRGALAECWGLAWLPLVFWTGERAIRAGGGFQIACALAWSGLLLSHGITALIASVPYAIWLGWWLRDLDGAPGSRSVSEALRAAVLTHLLSLGLAAWFVVPSLLELRYVHSQTLTSLYPWARFENNFLQLGELFSTGRDWGYGAFRSPDGMSLFLGPLHLAAAATAGVGLAWARVRGRLQRGGAAAGIFLAFAAGASCMTLSLSRPIWEIVSPLAYLQFPWRFLSIACLGLSFSAGWIFSSREERPRLIRPAAAVLCLAAIVVSWTWYKPSAMHEVHDAVLANPREIAKSRHGLFDFLPASVDLDAFLSNPPRILPPPVERSPEVVIRSLTRSSRQVDFDATVRGDATQVVTLNTYRFPGWTLEVDGSDVPPSDAGDDSLGRLAVELEPGSHHVTARFENTWVRSASNGVSVLALAACGVWLFTLMRPTRMAE